MITLFLVIILLIISWIKGKTIPADTLTFEKVKKAYDLLPKPEYPPIDTIRVNPKATGKVGELSMLLNIVESEIVPEHQAILTSGNDFCGIIDFEKGEAMILTAEKFKEYQRQFWNINYPLRIR